MKPLLLLLGILTFSVIRAQTFQIYFNINSAEIGFKEKSEILKLAEAYKLRPAKISIKGHADTSGASKANMKLSEQRAQAVKVMLTTAGVKQSDMLISFYGDTRAAASKDESRRVDISMESVPTLPEKTAFENLLQKNKPHTQMFSVDQQGGSIIGAGGTIITIPPNAFTTINGAKVEGEVEIKLREFLTRKHCMAEGLGTVSDGTLLETAGMIEIRAYKGDEELKLTEGTELNIGFKRTMFGGFSTFYGEATAQGGVNWKPEIEKPEIQPLAQTQVIEAVSKTTVSKARHKISRRTKRVIDPDSNLCMSIAKPFSDSVLNIKSSKLNWINCDRFLSEKKAINVHYQVKGEYSNLTDLRAYLIFNEINSILPLTRSRSNTMEYSGKIATELRAWVMVLGSRDDQLYMGLKPAALYHSMDDIELELSDETKIQAAFENFN